MIRLTELFFTKGLDKKMRDSYNNLVCARMHFLGAHAIQQESESAAAKQSRKTLQLNITGGEQDAYI